jgi:hypothetical protein
MIGLALLLLLGYAVPVVRRRARARSRGPD